MESSPESLGHDGVENRIEDGVKVVEDSRDHEEDMLGLMKFEDIDIRERIVEIDFRNHVCESIEIYISYTIYIICT